MTKTGTTIPGNLSLLRFTLILVAVLSILFPSLFAFINRDFQLFRVLLDILVSGLILCCIAIWIFAIRLLAGKISWLRKWPWLRIPIELLISLTGSFWILYRFYLITRNTHDPVPVLLEDGRFRLYIVVNLLGALFIYMLQSTLQLYQSMSEQEARQEKLQQEFSQVRLQALRNQVNPHFLFNSLSVLSSLVQVNPDTAERFIIQLSKAYRYILDQQAAELVSLAAELDFLNAYFYLLQIRFDQKIKLETSISVPSDQWLLPPLTIQLLVENAVKHNRMSVAQPLLIAVSADNGIITVTNNLNSRDEQVESTGIGLENIRKRMAYFTSKPVVITQTDKLFTVSVPLIEVK